MEPAVEIPTLGVFEANRSEDGSIYCYSHTMQFRGRDVEVIIYPNDDDSPLSEYERDRLRQQFRKFEQSLDAALTDLPRKLRPLCREYEIGLAHASDDVLVSRLGWINIKLDPDGSVECYTFNPKVSSGMDIVLSFSSEMQLEDVRFDG